MIIPSANKISIARKMKLRGMTAHCGHPQRRDGQRNFSKLTVIIAAIEHMLHVICVKIWDGLEEGIPRQTAGINNVNHELRYEGIGAVYFALVVSQDRVINGSFLT